MNNTRDSLTNHLDRLTAQSLKLSRELSRELEAALAQEGVTLGEANDDPERLLRLQQVMYPPGQHDPADSRLQRRICDTGRDGQHLFGGGGALQKRHPPALLQPQRQQPGSRLRWSTSAVSPTSPGKRTLSCTTDGTWSLTPTSSRASGSSWTAPWYRPVERYFWSRRIDLKDTWESAMLLCVPIVGGDGRHFTASAASS